VLDFKPYSWFSRQINRVDGYILDENNKKVALLNGKWDEFLYSTNKVEQASEFFKLTDTLLERDKPDNKNKEKNIAKQFSSTNLKSDDIELIWKTNEQNDTIHIDYYNFSDFTLRLNELYDELTKPNLITIRENSLSRTVQLGPIPPTDSRLFTFISL
jgi:hypothetical protein